MAAGTRISNMVSLMSGALAGTAGRPGPLSLHMISPHDLSMWPLNMRAGLDFFRRQLDCKSKSSKREEVEAASPLKASPELAQHHFHCIGLVEAITEALMQGQEK